MDHCTPKWETSILKTSKSSRKSVSDIVHSFIASFRVDDDLVSFCRIFRYRKRMKKVKIN